MTSREAQPHYHGHRKRLKERFLQCPESLPDYELLELLLYLVYPRQDVKPKAKALLGEHGSLLKVLRTSEFPATSSVFQLVLEVSRRLLQCELRQTCFLNNTQRVIEYCHLTMAHEDREQFRVFFLDRKYGLIAEELQQEGTVDQVPIYPREVLKRALMLNANCILIVHNHPSGDPTPSSADIEMTKHLKNSLLPVHIQLLDHLIIGKHGHFSFKQKGLL